MSAHAPIVIVLALFVVIGLRVWRRRRHLEAEGPAAALRRLGANHLRLPARLGDVGLVATREVRERVRGRMFRVITVVVLLGVAAAIVIPSLVHGSSRPERIGIVGPVPGATDAVVAATGRAVGTDVRLVHEQDVAAARLAVRAGRIDLAIVDDREIVTKTAVSSADTSTTAELARALSRTLGLDAAMRAAGLSAVEAARVAAAGPLPIHGLEQSSAKRAASATSIIGLIVVFIMLTQYNTWTLMGVMEEKSSRVVEVLLSAIRPIQLLTGKVLGIGLVAFAQAGLIVVVALALAKAVGSELLQGSAPLEVAATLVWLVLGYGFYSWVYAAAGSMAERQDQVQSLAFPLSLPIVFGYVVGLTLASSANVSLLAEVLAYLPPTAPFIMPILVGLKAVSWWQFTGAVVLSLVCTFAVARLAAGVYRRAILRTGQRVRFRDVVSSRAG